MPKSFGKRKANPGKGVDFKRVRHKVGKALPRAQNATDTTVRSAAITLTQQSVAVERTGQAVTSRALSLKEVLGQCGHYSSKVRRQAVQGAAELARVAPLELCRSAGAVLRALGPLIGDVEDEVRSALLTACRESVFPALGSRVLGAHLGLLGAHASAALTQQAQATRSDALAFQLLLLRWALASPGLGAAQTHALPALQHLAAALGRRQRGRSLQAAALGPLVEHLHALDRVLALLLHEGPGDEGVVGVGEEGKGGPDRGRGKGGRVNGRHGKDSVGKISPAESSPAATALTPPPHPLTPPLGGRRLLPPASPGFASAALSDTPHEARVSTVLQELVEGLLHAWEEGGIAALASEPSLLPAQCLALSASCFRRACLLSARLGSSPRPTAPSEALGSLTDAASPAARLAADAARHFPMRLPVSARAAAGVEEAMAAANESLASVLVLLLPQVLDVEAERARSRQAEKPAAKGVSPGGLAMYDDARPASAPARGARRRPKRGQKMEQEPEPAAPQLPPLPVPVVELPAWVERLLGWYEAVLQRDEVLPPPPTAAAPSPARRRPGLGWETYRGALSGVEQALACLDAQTAEALLQAAWALWSRSPAGSEVRRGILDWWNSLLHRSLAFHRRGAELSAPLLPVDPVPHALFFLDQLPRCAFESAAKSPATAQRALCALRDGLKAGWVSRAAQSCFEDGSPKDSLSEQRQQSLAALDASLSVQVQALWTAPVPRVDWAEPAAQCTKLSPRPLLAGAPAEAQEAACDALWHLPSLSPAALQTLAAVAASPHSPPALAARAVGVAWRHPGAGRLTPAARLSFLLTVLSGARRDQLGGAPGDGDSEGRVEQKREVEKEEIGKDELFLDADPPIAGVLAACDALLQLPSAAAALDSLAPSLASVARRATEPTAAHRARRGLLSVSRHLARSLGSRGRSPSEGPAGASALGSRAMRALKQELGPFLGAASWREGEDESLAADLLTWCGDDFLACFLEDARQAAAAQAGSLQARRSALVARALCARSLCRRGLLRQAARLRGLVQEVEAGASRVSEEARGEAEEQAAGLRAAAVGALGALAEA